jgi:hypothetical protein
MLSTTRFISLIVLALSSLSANAFVTVSQTSGLKLAGTPESFTSIESNSALSERRWNFNDGQAPWGLKKNAELWNGRVSQVCLGQYASLQANQSDGIFYLTLRLYPTQVAFVWVFLQELVTGKGVFKGIEEGDIFFLANFGLFGVGVVGLTGWLALQGDDDYTKEA